MEDLALLDFKAGGDVVNHFAVSLREGVGGGPAAGHIGDLVGEGEVGGSFAEHLPHGARLVSIELAKDRVFERGIGMVAHLHSGVVEPLEGFEKG